MFIDSVPDEVTKFFIIIIVITIVYFGWLSTDTRDTAVGILIVENNDQSYNPFVIPGARRSDSQLSNRTESEEIEVANNVITDLENDITDFMNSEELTLTHDTTTVDSENNINHNFNQTTSGERPEEAIIRQMDEIDATTNQEQPNNNEVKDTQLRHRKVANTTTVNSKTETVTKEGSDNASDENTSSSQSQSSKESRERELTVKLKYLNDELKSVTARSSEAIGDFKKRNFTEELAANKLVRLVFNGHVLQPDKKTLAECGLFDNCVVHCLIHNQRPNDGSSRNDTTTGTTPTSSPHQNHLGGLGDNIPSESFLNRPEHGRWYLYISLIFISFTLIFCWFCRLQYAYLFSFYSTIGLVLMSILFVAMIPLIILIERDVVG